MTSILRRMSVLVVTLTVAGVSGCSGPGQPTGSAGSASGRSTVDGTALPLNTSPVAGSGQPRPGEGTTTTADTPLGQSRPGEVIPGTSAEPDIELPEATATLNPPCVLAGDKVVLTVDTGMSWSSVVYLAYYQGGKNGAPPPWGDGYGGNDGGASDADGRYIGAWIVRADTPKGPARVKVSILYPTGGTQSLIVPFRVIGIEDVSQAAGC